MTNRNELADRYVALWNEPDADRRRAAIAELWTEDGVHVLQPPQEIRDVAARSGPGLTARLEARGPRMAERAALSERHFARLFAAETGTTPARFVERARVEAARDLLEAGPTSVETVATQAGFGSDETMRRAFMRVLGVAPADYRARFGGASFQVVDAREAS
jgi:AraC-like DNA-binding protein